MVLIEIQVIPSGGSPPQDQPYYFVERAIEVIKASGLKYEVEPLGTTIEGELSAAMSTAMRAHHHLGSSHGYRCGAAFVLASASLALTGPGGELFEEGERRLIEACLEAVVDLAQVDRTAHPVEGGSPD
jgi:uncharacterized protein YqgV (UPF0045/DUF77 family)